MRANFQAKGVKEMLETNYKAWKSTQQQEQQGMEVEKEEEFDIDSKLEEILEESGHADNRGAKMGVDDFLGLLALFHKHGIHFGG